MKIQITITINVRNENAAFQLSSLLSAGIGFETVEENMCTHILTMDYNEYKLALCKRMTPILDELTDRYINSYMSKLTTEIQ